MQSQTALKIAIALGVLSVIGSTVALWKGVPAINIAVQLMYILAPASFFLLSPIADLFPQRTKEIAVSIALMSAALGGLSIYRYSTEHVALSLAMISTLWALAADLLTGRSYLARKTLGGIYQEFKAGKVKPSSPLAKTLERGAMVLMLASIVCLFTITTW